MNQNFRGWVSLLTVIIASILLFPGCANIVPPSGGPKDTLAPVLLGASPADSSLHFKAHKVTMQFSEYVELDNIFEKLIVSPTLKRTPTVTAKLRTVTMIIKDTLDANTTYTFNFSDAIRDINEHNPIQDYAYVVSTGDYLDSLQIKGFIINAENGKPDSNVSVMLYRHLEDSVVSKEKPVYYARSRGNGSFWFKNLAPGDYKIFAIKEENKDLQYNDPKELIAFQDSLLHLREENLHDVPLLTFLEKDSTLRGGPEAIGGPDSTSALNIPPPPPEQEDKKTKEQREKEKKRRILVSATLGEKSSQDLGMPLIVNFSAPVKTLDTTHILLTEDTTFNSVPFTTFFDSTRKVLHVVYTWKEGMPYRLTIPKEAVLDTLGQQQSKADTILFNAKKESDYGSAMLTLTLSDSLKNAGGDTMHFVAQLVKDKEIKYSGKIVKGAWIQKRIQPAEYEIRILLDDNNNGVWDRGVYYGTPKKQPERVVTFPKKENIKANWGVPIKLQI
ncbi:Ig-like domain-containing protein [Chitinophaga sancti]|uniref:Ig-like domain-containing protein n=1 Tax=Chitinophaga sancti TaxID=1004 RepID=A0A1K1RH43_9BACT|nr:Ig-like domain-containing protein [Chitinophaga sancti]WQD60595.1 Ig-like domain-containing protein [Chitinophaga sancti]WQG87277.1 Ig-like domain-containing protein [Chitinophaga sancti]SFW71341.1 Ig-like domain-containing protein [Chitinophaga sancti]